MADVEPQVFLRLAKHNVVLPILLLICCRALTWLLSAGLAVLSRPRQARTGAHTRAKVRLPAISRKLGAAAD